VSDPSGAAGGSRLTRRVAVPRVLRELHGEAPRVVDLLAVYLAALIGAASVLLLGALADPSAALWRRALVALVALDVVGGAVATFTTSTASYYSGRPGLRRVFIGLHVLHPGVLAALYPASAALIALTGLYTVAAAFAVDALPGAEDRRLAAAVLVAVGVTLFSVMGVPSPLLSWFAPVFLVKLVGGFAAARR
jgi:hypothetical protein